MQVKGKKKARASSSPRDSSVSGESETIGKGRRKANRPKKRVTALEETQIDQWELSPQQGR